jgi:Zn-dependent protease/ribosomal protein L37AE/L43A
VAIFEIQNRARSYSSLFWNVLEYLTLFLIVLLHEFGHSLACRQVGGKANQIILWPMGGIAFVSPPPRPAATLWSIAAGPLVNVALLPLLSLLWYGAALLGWEASFPDGYAFVRTIWGINLGLAIFNLLPIYPLDGGQILQALLWFFLGRARSLMVASIIGMAGVVGLLVVAVLNGSFWIGFIAVFILINCWGGLMRARSLARMAEGARHQNYACPSCHVAPPVGALWRCSQCQQLFDTFASQAVCPQCGTGYAVTHCPECGVARPISEWQTKPAAPPPLQR